LEPDELLVEVEFPAWNPERKFAFIEFARRKGDFALAGICTALDLDRNGNIERARVVSFGVTDTQRRLPSTEAYLESERLSLNVCAKAAQIAVSEIDASTDLHATAEYRKALSGTLQRAG
jgi:aerobic carbon-monoxide dehydrogenase medium subunit